MAQAERQKGFLEKFEEFSGMVSGLEGNFSVNDLLTEPFLQKYTSFKNLEAFQTAVGKKLETVEDLTALNGTDVLKQTKFATGEELLHQAVEDYVAAAFAD